MNNFFIFLFFAILTSLNARDINKLELDYKIIKVFPHDVNAFTEGLFFHDGKLFESSGAPKELPLTESVLGVLNLKIGKLEIKNKLDKKIYFAEGITYFKDKIYQLTYKSQVCFVYDSKSFKKIKKYKYLNKEGWGLTANDNYLIMSDGSSLLFYINQLNFKIVKTLKVTFNDKLVKNLNELEYVKGYIYANIWLTDFIVKINNETGHVEGIIDLTSLRKIALQKNNNSQETNGIAYDSKTDTFFVTGKMWPYIFQIKFE